MTDKDKLIKIKKLADALYNAAANQGPVGSGERLHKAMDEYHQFIIQEWHKEEPKKCVFTLEHHTEEDRKVLCKGCEEECKFNKKGEPVSEDLEEEIENYLKDSLAVKFPTTDVESIKADVRYIARHFAEWQRMQIIKDDKRGVCKDNYIEFADGTCIDLDPSMQLKPAFNIKDGDKVKVLLSKV